MFTAFENDTRHTQACHLGMLFIIVYYLPALEADVSCFVAFFTMLPNVSLTPFAND